MINVDSYLPCSLRTCPMYGGCNTNLKIRTFHNDYSKNYLVFRLVPIEWLDETLVVVVDPTKREEWIEEGSKSNIRRESASSFQLSLAKSCGSLLILKWLEDYLKSAKNLSDRFLIPFTKLVMRVELCTRVTRTIASSFISLSPSCCRKMRTNSAYSFWINHRR